MLKHLPTATVLYVLRSNESLRHIFKLIILIRAYMPSIAVNLYAIYLQSDCFKHIHTCFRTAEMNDSCGAACIHALLPLRDTSVDSTV